MNYDIVSILYNLLSNSFEACENLKSNDKWINLKIGIINYFLIINVKNSSENNIVMTGTTLQTSKKNKLEHGLGSRSVYEIVNKYHGQVQYENLNGVFTADVIMSYKL